MSDNKEGPVCSFCGAKKGQYSEIYKSNIGDQYICKECTEELARYSGVIEEALKRYQYLEAHNKNAGSEAPVKSLKQKRPKSRIRFCTESCPHRKKSTPILTNTLSDRNRRRKFFPLLSTTITSALEANSSETTPMKRLRSRRATFSLSADRFR